MNRFEYDEGSIIVSKYKYIWIEFQMKDGDADQEMSLTPAQARELAEALLAAADGGEA